MTFEKRYYLQVKMNTELREKVEALTAENEKLKRENEWSRVVKESQQEELKGIAEEMETAYEDFKKTMAELKYKRRSLENEIKLARKDRAKFKKRMDALMKQIKDSYNLEDSTDEL